MPNRIIKESICSNDKIASLSDFEFRLWVGLITQVDDAGRGDARPAIIKGSVFPLRDRVTIKDIDAALHALAAKGCISLYTVDGKSYFWFPSWAKHQRVRDCRPKYPAPEESVKENVLPQSAAGCGELRQTAEGCGLNPIQSESNPNPNLESESEKGTRRRDAFEEFAGEDKEMLLALKDFEEMRKKLKKPMTERARQMIIAQLKKLSSNRKEQIAILEQSVMRSWAGIFSLKKDQGNPTLQVEKDYTADWDSIPDDNTCGKDYGGSFY